jgi:hypothetical protein
MAAYFGTMAVMTFMLMSGSIIVSVGMLVWGMVPVKHIRLLCDLMVVIVHLIDFFIYSFVKITEGWLGKIKDQDKSGGHHKYWGTKGPFLLSLSHSHTYHCKLQNACGSICS